MRPISDRTVDVRRTWMGLLAKADPGGLETAWRSLGDPPRYDYLRRPETGLALVRARAGGTGRRFNLGEMSLTRCVVRLDNGIGGYGFVAGRNGRHAELAALFDALLMSPERHDRIAADVIAPLARAAALHRTERAARAAATKVEFFTMTRGE